MTIRTFGVLASILDDALNDGRLARNPARSGRMGLPKKTHGTHVYLTHEQVISLAKHSGDQKLLVLVLAYTGVRWGEAIALRVRDLDIQNNRLMVTTNAVEVQGTIHLGSTKSGKGRPVPVPGFLMEQLTRRAAGLSASALLFPGPTGKHMVRVRTSQGSKSWFKTALKSAGLQSMTIHDLRHTAASLSVQSGAHVKTIQRMLGHASAAMTLDVYADLFENDLDSIAEKLDDRARKADADGLFDA